MAAVTDKHREFRRLHEAGCFVIPNPWDAGTARYLQGLGFPALATTSAGAAWALGCADGEVPLHDMLAHIRQIATATELPVNADFMNCFADDPNGVATNVRLCIETGVAGLSIEDSSGDKDKPLYEFAHAVERVRAAREAADESSTGAVLTARAENFLVGKPDIDDAIKRIAAYAEAGADCLYVPGIRTREQIEAVVRAVAPKPVNLLVGYASEFTVLDIAAMGVRRISVGGALARAAWKGFTQAAKSISEAGRFEGFADLMPNTDLNRFFHQDQVKRGRS